jgi:hypothetical protein
MKATFITIALGLLVATLFANDLPDDIQTAQSRYNNDIESAIKPIRDRYVAKLENAKKTAILRNDIKAAEAIAAEIERVSANFSNPTDILCAYYWSNHHDKWEFTPGGKLIQRGIGWGGKTWKFSPDQNFVELVFFNDQKHIYAFQDGILVHYDPSWGAFQKSPKKRR